MGLSDWWAYAVLMKYLHKIDSSFKTTSFASYSASAPPKKRKTDARIQSMASRGDKQPRYDARTPYKGGNKRVDNRPACSHCNKPGHHVDSCWVLHPDKLAEFKARRDARRNPAALPPAQLQAITAQVAAALAAQHAHQAPAAVDPDFAFVPPAPKPNNAA